MIPPLQYPATPHVGLISYQPSEEFKHYDDFSYNNLSLLARHQPCIHKTSLTSVIDLFHLLFIYGHTPRLTLIAPPTKDATL
jgi:hypothetical protein